MVKDALFSATCWFDCDALRLHTVLGALWLVLFPSARTCSLERSPRYALRSRARAEGKIPAPSSRPPVRNAGSGTDHEPASGGLQWFVSDSPQAVGYHVCRLPRWVAGSPGGTESITRQRNLPNWRLSTTAPPSAEPNFGLPPSRKPGFGGGLKDKKASAARSKRQVTKFSSGTGARAHIGAAGTAVFGEYLGLDNSSSVYYSYT